MGTRKELYEEKLAKDFEDVFDALVNSQYFTEEELKLVCHINGFNIESLNSAIYARYAYRDLEQLLESE